MGFDSKGKPKTILDGWGLQSHYDLTMIPDDIKDIYGDISNLQNWLEENGCTPLEVQVTEMDVANGRDKYGKVLPADSTKYPPIWQTTFECAKEYGIKSFTGWGISDNLSWFPGIDCTMIDKHGRIKDFAKPFIDRINVKETTKNAIISETTTEKIERWNAVKSREKEIQEPESKTEKE